MPQEVNVVWRKKNIRLRIRNLHYIDTYVTVKSERYPAVKLQSPCEIHKDTLNDEAWYMSIKHWICTQRIVRPEPVRRKTRRQISI
jgi:hypothetical protein